ncbi:hypothetical protein [Archangium sp.]|uniref:hypothetical protein n=1 Tax=Archangium sp. TaxID=1872627 RepID=UPI002D25D8F5|nr:hypothetical protein [Archangium sp.]HYO54072.1 hypothetical protein [Archangium sp.]
MKTPLRVIVLGEGKDERGKSRTLPPFARIPHEQQGAMEILVRRALYPLLNDGQSWHRGLKDGDGIHVLQPPAPRLPRQPAMTELLTDPNALAPLVSAALKPLRGPVHADLLVATHDKDGAHPSAIKAVHVVNTSLGTHVPLLLPAPEIQAWLTRKRAIEHVYGREHCSVPEPDEEALKKDAKAELLRLLSTFGGRFNAKIQASLAEWISAEDLPRYDWSGWNQASDELKAALAAHGLDSMEP